jgi:uncharacterized protein
MDLGEQEVMEALNMLRDRHVVYRVEQAGARVSKYMHRLSEQWNLEVSQLALFAVLLLRGPQTVGQLRQRSERMHGFRDLEQVRECLETLTQRIASPENLIMVLPASAGNKEVRYAHTLHEPVWMHTADLAEAGGSLSKTDSLPGIRERVVQLEEELARLRAEFEAFKGQF